MLDRLVERGVLQRRQERVLGVFRRTRYPTPLGAGNAVLDQLRAAVTGTGWVDERTAVLCALVAATGLGKRVFAGLELSSGELKARIAEIGQSAWAATAVKKVLDEIQAAVLATTVASSSAATS